MNHFQLIVSTRIADHQTAEQARQEAERERIRREEQVRAAQAISTAQRSAAAAPAVAPLRAATPASAAPTTPPSLKLGTITERLGFALSADFLRSLGFEPAAKVGAHGVYHEAQFPEMLAALVRHIEGVQAKVAA